MIDIYPIKSLALPLTMVRSFRPQTVSWTLTYHDFRYFLDLIHQLYTIIIQNISATFCNSHQLPPITVAKLLIMQLRLGLGLGIPSRILFVVFFEQLWILFGIGVWKGSSLDVWMQPHPLCFGLLIGYRIFSLANLLISLRFSPSVDSEFR